MRVRVLRRLAATALLAATSGAGVLLLPASPASAAGTTTVSVVHGIPGQPVDVYLDGKKVLPNFQPGKVAGPLSVPSGTHDVALTKPGDAIGNALLKVDNAELPAGANITLVAHLTADGKPALTPFVNDTSRLAPGQARIVVRHTAAAPAVDVRAGGKPVFQGLTNPKEAKADLPAGSVSADVVLAGTGTVVLGPATLNLSEGTETIVYAIGSASGKSLSLVTQTISGLHSAPSGVPTGNAGLAAPRSALVPVVAALAGLMLLAGAGWRLRRSDAAG
jgi:uncharacterized protein DUF4397